MQSAMAGEAPWPLVAADAVDAALTLHQPPSSKGKVINSPGREQGQGVQIDDVQVGTVACGMSVGEWAPRASVLVRAARAASPAFNAQCVCSELRGTVRT